MACLLVRGGSCPLAKGFFLRCSKRHKQDVGRLLLFFAAHNHATRSIHTQHTGERGSLSQLPFLVPTAGVDLVARAWTWSACFLLVHAPNRRVVRPLAHLLACLSNCSASLPLAT